MKSKFGTGMGIWTDTFMYAFVTKKSQRIKWTWSKHFVLWRSNSDHPVKTMCCCHLPYLRAWSVAFTIPVPNFDFMIYRDGFREECAKMWPTNLLNLKQNANRGSAISKPCTIPSPSLRQRPSRQNNVLLPLALFTCMERGFHKRGDNHLRPILGVNGVYYRSHSDTLFSLVLRA
jgi:hypothetical protein